MQPHNHSVDGQLPVPVVPEKGTGRRLGIFAGILAIVLVTAFVFAEMVRSHWQSVLEKETVAAVGSTISVDVAHVRPGPATQSLELPGETRAWYESTIYARVSGYVADWSADIGDHVKKGQVLANIDTPELDDQLLAAQAKIKSSQSEVKVAQANADFAKSTYERWWESPQGVVSDQERQEKKSEYDSAIAHMESAAAQVNLDQADVDRLNAMSTFKKVTAPFDGVITSRRIDIGDLVTAGSTSSTTSLYNVAQSDEIRVFADVPQTVSFSLKPGMMIQAISEDQPGRVFIGKIARTSQAIDPQSKTLRVEADIPNPDGGLLPGMYVRVNFDLPLAHLLELPASALVFRSGGPEAAVVDGSGVVTFHKITIAKDNGDSVEISSGLAIDDRVVLNISSQINDGDTVSAVDTDKPAAAPTPQLSQATAKE